MGVAKRVVRRKLREELRRRDLELQRRQKVPFGVRWRDDLAWCLGGAPLGVAFDVGAHRGETTAELLEAFPDASVHCFEPLPENFAALAEATAGTTARAVNAAMSDTVGTLTLARGNSTFTTSVYAGGEQLQVAATTVDRYAEEQGLERVGLLKIDTEGHEPAVLRGASGLLGEGRISFVFCECDFTPRPGEPHAAFADLHATLEPLGYRVVSFYSGCVDNLGWIWGDVLYCHAPSSRDPGGWVRSPHQRRSIRGQRGALPAS